MRVLEPLAWFLWVFIGQIVLGYEIGLFPLYMIPVAALTWDFGWKGTAVGVIVAVCLWIWASALTGQEYSAEWIRYYNGIMRGVVYLVSGIFVLLFKHTLEGHRRRMDAMRSLLNVCHGCGAVQGSDGHWIPMDQLLTYRATPQQECPTCSRLNEG
jgi:hypothetical protein